MNDHLADWLTNGRFALICAVLGFLGLIFGAMPT
jgi:membrane-bound ClpP family serine protease